jgi:hypothetical protein
MNLGGGLVAALLGPLWTLRAVRALRTEHAEETADIKWNATAAERVATAEGVTTEGTTAAPLLSRVILLSSLVVECLPLVITENLICLLNLLELLLTTALIRMMLKGLAPIGLFNLIRIGGA